MLPLSRPVLSTVAVSRWRAVGSLFLSLPLLVLVDPDQHTLPIGVDKIDAVLDGLLEGARVHHAVDAAGAGLLRFAERHIVGGLTAGAVKE